MQLQDVMFIVLGVIAGAVAGALLVKYIGGRSAAELHRQQALNEQRIQADLADRLARETATVGDLRHELDVRAAKLAAAGEELAATRSTLEQLRLVVAATEARVVDADALAGRLSAARETLMETNAQLTTQVATLTEQRALEAAAAAEKLQLLNEARERLANEFKLVASEIMEVNAKRFAEQSQTQIGTVLNPLRERLVELHKKVDEVYVADVKDRTALREQVQSLVSLNQTLSDDARNLTNALRGSNKAQGNWGELILQRILEDAGLREGVEFILQDAQSNEDGRRQQPDVVIQLPEGRKIVVDAKVSMLAFERASSATSDDERGVALREHVLSVRNHVKGLSERRYERLYDTTLDFVVMFVPIEPAFMMAVTADERLCADAWDRNILLVSPSTLLFVLRTVAYLWRQEAQSKNAKDIAERGAALYDKLASFVKDLEEVGTRIDHAQQSFVEARKKLSTGRGSVIRQAEMLKSLGVKSGKHMPKALVDEAMSAVADDDDEPTESALLPTPQQ